MVILHTESSMNFGGQELRILLEMEGLKQYGIESVLACRPDSSIAAMAAARNLPCYLVPFTTSLDLLSVQKLVRIIRYHKVSIVNSHSSKDAWNTAWACKLLRIPFVRSRHIGLKIRTHIPGRLIYTTLPDKVLVTGKYIKDMLINSGVNASKISEVPTGVDLHRFALPRHARLKEELGLEPDVYLAGFVSVVKSDKGPRYFIESIPSVIRRLEKIRFVMVGGGNSLEKMKALAKNLSVDRHIYFTGHRDDIDFIMKGIDLFVLPAVKPEGVPQALLQAFASELPVIATDIGGVNEAALQKETALVVRPRDPEALADAIVYLHKHPDVAARCASAGRRLVEERYTLQGMLENMKHFYESLLKA